jgi:FSR family fosmidomycin resistance protein-like MFS transporter
MAAFSNVESFDMKMPRPILLLASGHFCVDLYSSMLAAFLPFLQDKLGLTLSQAGMLAGVLVFSSSLSQPIYGLLSDRVRNKMFVVLGPATAGVFISCLGLAPGIRSLFLLLLIAGVGVAAYHPQGAALTHSISQKNHAFNMSLYVTAGTVGFALGPIYITAVIQLLDLSSSYWAAIPGLLVTGLLYLYGPSPAAFTHHHPVPLREQVRGLVRPLLVLYGLVVIRSIAYSGISSFLPLYYTRHGYSAYRANQFLSVFLFAGGSAGLVGGWLADRYSGKKMLAFSFIASLPLFVGFLMTEGFVSVLFSSVGSAILLFSSPLNIVMAQKLMPRAASTVAALTMGFAWGTAGLFIPLVGSSIESFGFHASFAALILLTLPGFVLTLFLPGDDQVGSPAEPVVRVESGVR